MATQFVTIPLQELPYYEYSIGLEGKTYILTHRWNTREACFYFDIKTETGEPILVGLKLVPNYPIIYRNDLSDFGLAGFFYMAPINANETAVEITVVTDPFQYYFFGYYFDDGE